MVKGPGNLKGAELIAGAFAKLREVLGRPGFLHVTGQIPQGTIVTNSEAWQIDGGIQVESHGRSFQILIEAKANGQPMSARQAIGQLRYCISKLPEPVRSYGVFTAPYISPDAARICQESGIGYVDLAGNAHLEFADVYIDLRVADNPFKEVRENRPLFSGKGDRVLRVLLTPPLRPWKVTELSLKSGVSLGQVSTVRGHLLEREWAVADDLGLVVTRPEDLARAWQLAYKPKRETFKRYTVLHGAALDEAIKAAMHQPSEGRQLTLASFTAAKWIAPFARQGTTYLYATKEGLELADRQLQLQSAAQGENVVIWIPKEDDVFVSSIEVAPGYWSSGYLQTWLDLGAGGDRGKEAAEHFLQQELMPAWRSAIV